jgi:hypothetical protein
MPSENEIGMLAKEKVAEAMGLKYDRFRWKFHTLQKRGK